jgi:prepilin signal peptidase PulO-like enzyme (type II secretory pathway)
MKIDMIILAVFLIINTINDIRKREIHLVTIPFFILVFFIYLCFLQEQDEWKSSVVFALKGVIPGILLIIISVLTRGAVGIGDGLAVFVCGLFIGFLKNLMLVMGGFMLAAVGGVILIRLKKADRRTVLPFLPFLTVMFGLLSLSGFL